MNGDSVPTGGTESPFITCGRAPIERVPGRLLVDLSGNGAERGDDRVAAPA
jgi:hypothetical protein